MGLFDILKKLPTLNELTGGFGEGLAKFYTKTIPGVLVLHDVLIPGAEEYTSQIDLLIVGNRGIYVVEVKTYTDAKVYGDVSKNKWYYFDTCAYQSCRECSLVCWRISMSGVYT